MNISSNLINMFVFTIPKTQRNTKLDRHFALQIGYEIRAPYLFCKALGALVGEIRPLNVFLYIL